MRKRHFALLAVGVILSGQAWAVSPGTVLEFNGGPMGKVLFDGTVHKEAGTVCKDCHNDEVFPRMQQGTVEITMEEIYAGRLCGVCHDGKRAFAPQGNCNRCHVRE